MARPYRWLEYVIFGRSLERCRLNFLPQLADRTRALALGDGDGRFLAALFHENPSLTADAVDTSGSMLELLRKRCMQAASDIESRLWTHRIDALSYLAQPTAEKYDLIVTHFFLDCLTQSEVGNLAAEISTKVTTGAIWVVSEFRIPSGLMRLPAQLLIRYLYLAFRIITGLRANRLPNHVSALNRAGFVCVADAEFFFGMLTTEIWAVGSRSRNKAGL